MNIAIISKPLSRILCGALGLFFLLIIAGCSSWFFYPHNSLIRTPTDIGLEYEDVRLEAEDGVLLHGWYLKAPNPKATVFFLHGNAENISTHIGSVHWLPEQGYNVFLLDYRGYGVSQGEPSLPDVFLDIKAAIEWTSERSSVDGVPVVFFGQSLGASLGAHFFAMNTEHRKQIELMVLDAPFSGFSSIASDAMARHWFTYPLSLLAPWVLSDDYDPLDSIGALKGLPVLIMHSEDDQVIPIAHGKRLFQRAGSPKNFFKTHGGHIETFSVLDNRLYFIGFVEKYLRD